MNHPSRGFSLLEMIAVMAITAVLAGTLAPSLVKTVQDSYSVSEDNSLQTLGDSLTTYVLNNKRIPSPDPTDWGPALAEITSVSPNNITHNQRDFTRAIFFDPKFFTNSETTFSGFTQNLGLLQKPYSPRVILVSDLSSNATHSQLNSTQFNAIWVQSNDALFIEDETVKVQRINMNTVFHQLLLTNQYGSEVAFSLDEGSVGAVPAKAGSTDGEQNRFVIQTSLLRLRRAPFPTGEIESSLLVNSSSSFSFADAGGSWGWTKP